MPTQTTESMKLRRSGAPFSRRRLAWPAAATGLLLLTLLAGCVTAPSPQMPHAGKYDHDETLRNAYLRAYGDGYREGWEAATSQTYDPYPKSDDPRLNAANFEGFDDGANAGRRDRAVYQSEFLKRTTPAK